MTVSTAQPRSGGARPASDKQPSSTAGRPHSGNGQGPRPVADDEANPGRAQNALLSHLLKFESKARLATSDHEVTRLLANELGVLVRARQVFVLQRRRRRRVFRLQAVSSMAKVDRKLPLVAWIEGIVVRLSRTADIQKANEFVLPANTKPADPMTAAYPFAHMLWVPFPTRQRMVRDGMLLARETAWVEADRMLAGRLAETFGHALALQRAPLPAIRRPRHGLRLLLAAMGAVVALGFVPAPITVLAPFEVTPRDPWITAMPVDGVVHAVTVPPNAAVEPGQRLVQLVDTAARNKLDIATGEVAIAQARADRASSLAFSDAKGRHELGIARAELAVRIAERDHARKLLGETRITAATGGIAVFSDRRDLEGKPFFSGDRLMQIARPGVVELKIDLPVADSVALKPGAKVRAFLDSDPLNAVEGWVTHTDYQARLSDAGVAIYRVTARLADDVPTLPPLGTRGTAQLFGPDGTLALLALRRPLSTLRQWAGW